MELNCEGVECRLRPVFAVDDAWHGLTQCMRDLRDTWSRRGGQAEVDVGGRGLVPVSELVKAQILKEMRAPRTVFVFKDKEGDILSFDRAFGDLTPHRSLARVSLLNNRNWPYNAMGQTGLAYFLDQMANLAARDKQVDDARFYRSLAVGSIDAVLAPVSNGGLSTVTPCEAESQARCRWFHSITRRDLDNTVAGATLNQHLHAVRDLGLIVDQWRKFGEDTASIEIAVDQGIDQLILSKGHTQVGAPPNLIDYLGPARGKLGLRWAYYGFNPLSVPPKGGYCIGAGGDCRYHHHSLTLLAAILQRAEKLGRVDAARAVAFRCDSAVAVMYRTARTGAGPDGLPVLGTTDERDIRSCATPLETNLYTSSYLAEKFERCAGE